MARTVRDTNLDSRTARGRLAVRKKPYWRKIDQGSHVGYYKGTRSGAWIARYFLGNGKYAESKLGTTDDVQDADGIAVLSFSQAQTKARDWFAEQAKRDAGLPAATGPYTVADAMRDYLEWYAWHRKPSGLSFTRYAINAHILPALGSIAVNSLTTNRIEKWHQNLAAAPARVRSGKFDPVKHRPAPTDANGERARKATANRLLVALRAGLNRAFRDPGNGILSDAAWRRVERFEDVDAARVRYLSGEECTRLINASGPNFRPLVQAALLTGARYGELIAMQCNDYNLDAGTVSVYESKSGEQRHIPLNDEGVMLFAQLTAGREGPIFVKANGEQWGQWQQARPLAAAAKAAKVEGATFHILRHTYGSALAMQGVPMSVIANALGHSSTRMTEKHYAHLSPSYVAETIRANLPKLGIIVGGNIEQLKPQATR